MELQTQLAPLQLNSIEVNEDYLKEWNENLRDFLVLARDGQPIRNTLYRKGGLNTPKVGIDRYFMLLKYTEDIYDYEFIKKCYPAKSRKELEKERKHLKSQWVILDSNGNEKVVFDQFKNGYLPNPNSPIYSTNSNYYNIETGYFYGYSSSSFKSSEFLFLENNFDKDHSKRGVLKIRLDDGSFELFK